MGDRINAALAGPDYGVLQAVEYDYVNATSVALTDDTNKVTANALTGLYRFSADVDMYVTVATAPVASRTDDKSFYVPAGTIWHELLNNMKVAAINKTNGTTGKLRLHPAKKVD